MNRLSLVAGLAASAVVASLASAQEQAPTAAPPPAAAPSCSGLGCLFNRTPAPPAPPPAQAAAEPDPAASVPADEAHDAPKPRAKPVHPVIIAAEPEEMARLKNLAATMPRGKVKLVKDAARADEADFKVESSLGAHEDGEKAKLFTEQMHVIAGDKIATIADLKDKVVSFGPEKSPGAEAARKAFAALNVGVKETPLDLDNALDGLATGDVAAVVIVAPQPIERLAKLSATGLHLVAWPQDGALPAGASATTIDGARYPSLAKADAPIRTVGIDAVLCISAKGARRPESRAFLAALGQRSATLSKRGFDLIKADLDSRSNRRVASDEAR